MTDPALVHRAEQAYLGALLARQGRAGTGTAVAGDGGPDALAGLRPQDFADPLHQAIYAALAGQALPAPHGLSAVYQRLQAMLTRLLSPRTRAAAAYMAGLPGLCPDPANMVAYAAMVSEASHARTAPTQAAQASARAPQRRPSADSPRLASAAEWLDSTRGTSRRPAGARQTEPAYAVPSSNAGRTPDGLDRRTARLARALAAGVRRPADRTPLSAAPSPVPAENQAVPLSSDAVQEQVLADLMLNPAGRGDVTSWLPATAFAFGNNRTLYQLIRLRQDSGRPVDPLIIAWDASTFTHVPGSSSTQSEPLAAAALRVGALNPAPGNATVLARQFWTEQAPADAPGPDWWREPKSAAGPTPAAASATDPVPATGPPNAWQDPAVGLRPSPTANAASQAEFVPAAAERPVPWSPRHATGLPLRRPPLPGPTGPAPTPRG